MRRRFCFPRLVILKLRVYSLMLFIYSDVVVSFEKEDKIHYNVIALLCVSRDVFKFFIINSIESICICQG